MCEAEREREKTNILTYVLYMGKGCYSFPPTWLLLICVVIVNAFATSELCDENKAHLNVNVYVRQRERWCVYVSETQRERERERERLCV